jgi:hypothetical protein
MIQYLKSAKLYRNIGDGTKLNVADCEITQQKASAGPFTTGWTLYAAVMVDKSHRPSHDPLERCSDSLDLVSVLSGWRIDQDGSFSTTEFRADGSRVLGSGSVNFVAPLIYREDVPSDGDLDNLRNDLSLSSGPYFAKSADLLRLTIHWYAEALRSDFAFDRFVKLWVALDATIPDLGSGFRDSANRYFNSVFPLADPSTIAAHIDWLYDIRNQLVHEGIIDSDLGYARESLQQILESTLRLKLSLKPKWSDQEIFEM